MKLSSYQRSLIVDAINDIFYRLEARLLGRWFKGPTIYFSVVSESDPGETLEGAYRYALSMLYGPGASIDEKHLKDMHEIAQNYIEAERLKRVNKVLTDTAAATSEADLAQALHDSVEKATSYVTTLVTTETRNMQAYAEKDGITKLAASIGVDDPVVVKLGIVDQKLCKACRQLWHSQENISKPRPWRMSQLQDGYNKSQKDPSPTFNATHPHCRHVLSFVPPNFGFDNRGVIQFVGFGYDYHDDYHGTHKSEPLDEKLLKSCTCTDHHTCQEP